MDFELVAIALGDVTWITLAFVLGFAAHQIHLPPLVGFLLAGFLLNIMGAVSGEMLAKLSDLGITLLLFTIGLKLNIKTLLRPQVWAVTALHTTITVLMFGAGIFVLAATGVSLFADLNLESSLLLAFALSFSSTVFVVKVLEEKGDMGSLHGGIAIGILIMQDLLAVFFLTASTGKLPSIWALLLFGLFLIRPLLGRLLVKAGHGELLILYGLILALGGAEIFELVGMKEDLGALVLGVLVSGCSRSGELAKAMLGFKDLFLIGFFLSIGMSGHPTLETLAIAVLLAVLVALKSALFFTLLTRFRLRSRTALLSSLNLTNYSEFGLIVAAISASNGWIDSQWLVVIAMALALTFLLAAPLNTSAHSIYDNYRDFWKGMQYERRLRDDKELDSGDAEVVVFGMGRVGTGAYDRMRDVYGDKVIGIDFDTKVVASHISGGRRVLLGDPTDADFWDRVRRGRVVRLFMLTMPKVEANLYVVEKLKKLAYPGRITAATRYPDEEKQLWGAGVDAVYNLYSEAGVGFADHVLDSPDKPGKTYG